MGRRLILMAMLIIFMVYTPGCSTIPEQKDLEVSLRESVQRYWDIRLKGNVDDIYDMEVGEDLPPIEEYRLEATLMRRITIVKYDIAEITVTGKEGNVRLQVHIMVPVTSRPIKQPLMDRWIWDGKWKHLWIKKKR
jgi:hypothetical protein